jgi:isobutyryl-CoA mutase
MSKNTEVYKPKHPVRIVTAASLFDGHDAAINIMRRIIQASGVEVIHLGHNRSAQEIVDCAIQEDVQGIAITSYQGGHIEFFKYIYDLLRQNNCSHIKIFGGGGGTILPQEIQELHAYGITKIYSPDDGRKMGLQGMINHLVGECDFPVPIHLPSSSEALTSKEPKVLASLITAAENHHPDFPTYYSSIHVRTQQNQVPILGITGTGGAGKSSLTDELVRRFIQYFPKRTIGIISIDPSKRKTGGALLGDRIRMNSIHHPNVFMRSMATREANTAISSHIKEAADILKAAGFDLIILETSGIGQSGTEITEFADISMYVMTPEYGAATQLEKIDMLDFADIIALNKFDKKGAKDALKDVKKQYVRNFQLWDTPEEAVPVFGTIASQFNDPGMDRLFLAVAEQLNQKAAWEAPEIISKQDNPEKIFVIPPKRARYLSEISESCRQYDEMVKNQKLIAQNLYSLSQTINLLDTSAEHSANIKEGLVKTYLELEKKLLPENKDRIESWAETKNKYNQETLSYQVRAKNIQGKLFSTSLSGIPIPKICLPNYEAWGDILAWQLKENVPGEFPYTSGVFPLKRTEEDPARMFAGEGGPERTNKRFHYLSQGMPAKRLSTAFDSVTLYGFDPDYRPDIYGKVGNSGVSVCCLDDAKKLYAGFNLAHPQTSVSMTINGPAPILTAFFMNAAIDQQCEIYIRNNGLVEETESKIKAYFKEKRTEPPLYQGGLPKGNDGLGLMLLGITGDLVLPLNIYDKIKKDTLSQVRGTVQADILKEDQAQNTCIFSTEFALRLMGDVQAYFVENKVRNFYSVSISGYHIAEAGANPITQLALTLSNAFTYVEYYLSRGMHINDFAPNFSFFFSNGLDPEYAVIGRVARRIWAKAMKYKYGADERSQKLKYHVQTSGRSLHAQEIQFNDIRTTLQALYAIYDNCNSLHTNAYDEAITTPTEESVRRALAIQLIINKEYGLTKNENPLQGAFIIEELTDLVEEAVLKVFDSLTERGGVLGAMETMYQRNKIQEESLYYETLKHNGQLPIIGVNSFLSSKGSPTIIPEEVIRASKSEKENQINNLKHFQKHHNEVTKLKLEELKLTALNNNNLFTNLMETVKFCSLGQITQALFEVGGQYRRNM